jgi:hypothetical protein
MALRGSATVIGAQAFLFATGGAGTILEAGASR